MYIDHFFRKRTLRNMLSYKSSFKSLSSRSSPELVQHDKESDSEIS